MSGKRRNSQLPLAFPEERGGEAPKDFGEGTEPPAATTNPDDPVKLVSLMEEVLDEQNLNRAYRQILSNRGARTPGVDGMTVAQLKAYVQKHWPKIEEQLRAGTYRPLPVKRVEIPKPGGGVRKLGIPSALDRFLQQAVLQVLQPHFDPTFSAHSDGFRPGRSAHQAVAKAQEYQQEGYRWVVDMDLEKFFDRVNHDRLMARLAERIDDKILLKLIRAIPDQRCAGQRAGGGDERGDAAGRSPLAAAVEHRARRTRPRTGATRPPLREVRRRLQHLRSQSKGPPSGLWPV